MAGISGQDSKNSTHGRKKDRKRSITGIRLGGQEVDYKKSVDKQKVDFKHNSMAGTR